MSDRDERLVPHDWLPSEPLDDYGSIHWECRRCDDFVTLASGESPDDVDHLQGCSPTSEHICQICSQPLSEDRLQWLPARAGL